MGVQEVENTAELDRVKLKEMGLDGWKKSGRQEVTTRR